MVGKSSAVMGPLVFGTVSSAFGSQRPAILAISVFFIAGLLIIRHIRGGGPNIGQLDAPKAFTTESTKSTERTP